MDSYRFLDSKGEHLHTLNGKPLLGTSTVLSVLSKPLTWWASGLAVGMLGWTNPKEANQNARIEHVRPYHEKVKLLDPVEYLNLLDKAYRAHADKLDKAADKGTDMHAELEKYIKQMIADGGAPFTQKEYAHPAVKMFAEWATKNVKRFIVSEGFCYSSELWVGGITDCLAEMTNGQIGILDFKSSKDAYLSQFFQCAGYDLQVSENGIFDHEGNKLYELERPISFYAVFPFGMLKPEPQFHYDTEGAKEGFKHCVGIYKLINK